MRLLLDTHAYFWWATNHRRLSARSAPLLASSDTDIFLSAVVVWELATKARLGKWPGADSALLDLDDAIELRGLTPLPVTLAHARRAGSLTSPHKDPFDCMLAAQAVIERLTLVTADPAFRTLGCETFW